MDSSRGFFILLLVACCLLDLAFCQGNQPTPIASPPAPPAASPPAPAASDETPPPPPSPPVDLYAGVPGAPPKYGPDTPVPPPPSAPPMPVPSPGGVPPSPSPVPSVEPPSTPPPLGNAWNASEKAGVAIASIAALLQVAVVAFLLIKRHQMLSTVDYDDIDDLESDHIRHNANYRQAGSA